MTANQISFQANKLREEENAIKKMEADIKAAKQKVEDSKHLHDYGFFEVPNQNSDHQWGTKPTLDQLGARSSSTTSADKAQKWMSGIGSILKGALDFGKLFAF